MVYNENPTRRISILQKRPRLYCLHVVTVCAAMLSVKVLTVCAVPVMSNCAQNKLILEKVYF